MAAVNADVLLDRTDDEVVAELLEVRAVPRLEIFWEQARTPGPQETRIHVQHDLMYGAAGDGRQILIAADEVKVHVPLIVEGLLLQPRPSSFTLNPPRAYVGENEIVHTIVAPGLTAAQVHSSFEQFRAAVQQHADATNGDVDRHNQQVEAAIRPAVVQRRERLLAQRDLAASLSFQIRPARHSPRMRYWSVARRCA